jgi:hypothetical protein
MPVEAQVTRDRFEKWARDNCYDAGTIAYRFAEKGYQAATDDAARPLNCAKLMRAEHSECDCADCLGFDAALREWEGK